MRTRQRQEGPTYKGITSIAATQAVWNGHFWETPSPSTQSLPDFATSLGYESITDDPSRGRSVKHVDHTAYNWSVIDIPSCSTYYRARNGDIMSDYYTRSGPYSSVHQAGGNLPDIVEPRHISATYDKSTSDLVRDARHDLLNSLQVDNLTNILDTHKTVDLARAFLSGIGNLNAILRRSGGGRTVKPLKDFVRASARKRFVGGSNAYLAYQYGIAPLLSDLQTMAHSIKDLKSKIKRAVDNAGSVQSGYARSKGTFVLSNPGGSTVFGDGLTGDGGYRIRKTTLKPPTRTVSVRGHVSVKYSTSIFGSLDYLMKRFLSAGPASALWELIPYSFVVDWFVNLSSVIDDLDNVLTGATKSLIDASVSETYSIQCRTVYNSYYYAPWDADNVTNITGKDIVVQNVSYYRRDPVDPRSSVGAAGRFGKKQGTILAALLHQIVANLR